MHVHRITRRELLLTVFLSLVVFLCSYAVVGAQNPVCTPGSTNPNCQFTGGRGSQPPAVEEDPLAAFGGAGPSVNTNVTNPQSPRSFKELVGVFLGIIALLVPVIFGLALIVFFWGIIKAWILRGGDESEVAKGKQIALWGIIALVVMVGVWGIVAVLRSSLF